MELGEIIKVNFGDKTEISENIELDMTEDKRRLTPPSASDVCDDLARVRMNGLKVILHETTEGLFVVSIYKLGELTATFRRTSDFDKAWAVFSEIAKHIKDKTRNYNELVLILNNKIE